LTAVESDAAAHFRFAGALENLSGGRDDVMEMKTILGSASMMLTSLALAGCQSSDSGSGSRMLSRQDNSYARPPMNSYASTMPGNKSLAISDTNSRPGMLPSANAVQQASSMQNSTSASTSLPTSTSSSSVSGFDQAGSVVSRPMGDVSATVPSGPTPPSPPSAPGGYTIPAPTSYSPPPSTTSVPTGKPGDDQ
jgi:hypothetical protein